MRGIEVQDSVCWHRVLFSVSKFKIEVREDPKPHPTWIERAAREMLNTLNGKGAYSPKIFISEELPFSFTNFKDSKENKYEENRQPIPGNL